MVKSFVILATAVCSSISVHWHIVFALLLYVFFFCYYFIFFCSLISTVVLSSEFFCIWHRYKCCFPANVGKPLNLIPSWDSFYFYDKYFGLRFRNVHSFPIFNVRFYWNFSEECFFDDEQSFLKEIQWMRYGKPAHYSSQRKIRQKSRKKSTGCDLKRWKCQQESWRV